jgi:hypothetical protein
MREASPGSGRSARKGLMFAIVAREDRAPPRPTHAEIAKNLLATALDAATFCRSYFGTGLLCRKFVN